MLGLFIVFLIIHIIAFLTYPLLLLVTIPIHFIFALIPYVAWVIRKVAKYRNRETPEPQRIPLLNNERVIKRGGATYKKGKVGIGGWLYLTNMHLIFEAHSFNVADELAKLQLHKIVKVEKGAMRIIIHTSDESRYQIAVYKPSSWIAEITSNCMNIK